MSKVTKKAAIEFLREKLRTDDKWAQRGLLVIYARQTLGEQQAARTEEHNGVGFSGIHGEFLSSLAMQLQTRGSLSPKQMDHLKRKICKYARQILSACDMGKLARQMGVQ